MERYKVTGDQAFRMLVKVSNDNNLALRSVAENLPPPAFGAGDTNQPPAAILTRARSGRDPAVTGEVQDGRFPGVDHPNDCLPVWSTALVSNSPVSATLRATA